VVYVPSANAVRRSEIAWYDTAGRMQGKLLDEQSVDEVAVSPDESKIALRRFDTRKGAYDLYSYDVARGVRTRVTGGLSNHRHFVWAPDGNSLYFSSDRAGMYDIYVQADDGASPARAVWKGGDDKHPSSVSPDGRYLLATLYTPATRDDLYLVTLDGSAPPKPLVATEGGEGDAQFSPDGKWIAYTSSREGRSQVYVRGFPEGRSVQVSIDGGSSPGWSADGKQIFFRTPSDAVYVVTVAPQPSKPQLLFTPAPGTRLTYSRRSNRFAVVNTPSSADVITNYTNAWTAK
jgi:Tol biopolymer transport system component